MKYNVSEIMTKANKLRKAYGMSKSESLTKAWALAKLAKLEKESFYLEMKDRWNSADYDTSHKLSSAILELENALFPRIYTEHSRDNLKPDQRERMNKTLAELKAVTDPDFFTKNRIWNIEDKLANSIETWTSSKFDRSVYDAA